MVTSGVIERPLKPGQRRLLEASRAVLGGQVGVSAAAFVRANARWSASAQWVVGIFAAAFLYALIVLHTIIFPGALVVIIVYEAVRPRRGLVVTATGVAQLQLSFWSARPSSVIGTADHGALFDPRLDRSKADKPGVRIGDELLSVRADDLDRLQRAATAATFPIASPGDGVVSPPSSPATPSAPPIARWRRATFLWVVLHCAISFGLFFLLVEAADLLVTAAGRNTDKMADAAYGWIVVIWAIAILAWMLFVYLRRSFRTRAILLATWGGGGFLIAFVLLLTNSPPR